MCGMNMLDLTKCGRCGSYDDVKSRKPIWVLVLLVLSILLFAVAILVDFPAAFVSSVLCLFGAAFGARQRCEKCHVTESAGS